LTKSAPVIALELRASRRFGAALLAIAVLAVAAPWLSGLAWPVCAGLSLAAVLVGAQAWRGEQRKTGLRLALHGDDSVRCQRAGAADVEGTLAEAVVLGPLVTLALRTDGGRRVHLALWPDSADAESLRRLRVRLLARRRGPG
jgi:hypothetical protein